MANHALPTTTDLYTNVLTYLHARIDDSSKWYDSALTYSNPPTGVVRWNSTSLIWEKNTGTPAAPTWGALSTSYTININGTVGATTANSGLFTTLGSSGVASLGASSTVGGSAIVTVGGSQTFTGVNTFTNANPIVVAKIGPLVSTQMHTIPAVTSDVIALLAAAQAFTNKTYSSGVLTGTFTGNTTLSGQVTFTEATAPIITAKLGPSSTQQHTLPIVTSDTIALLTATQTLTNKSLGAVTLLGTVSGGGQQLNNIVIGTSTPLAGAFTTLSASGNVTVSNASYVTTKDTAATTVRMLGINSGNVAYVGTIDSSLVSTTNLIHNGAVIGGMTSTGLSVTGVLSASGNIDQIGAAATNRAFRLTTASSRRFEMAVNATTESGSNIGSDFELNRYSDSNVYLSTPLAINRATGLTTIGNGLFVTGALSATGAVTLSPASANVTISPTSTGTVTINPATTGTLNNVSVGSTTASTGSFTTLAASGAITFANVLNYTGTGSGTSTNYYTAKYGTTLAHNVPTGSTFTWTINNASTATLASTGLTVAGDITSTSQNGGQLAGLRNRIVNGEMRVDQRSNGSTLTLTGAAGGASQYCVDRWIVATSGTTSASCTTQRITSSTTTNRLKLTTTNANVGTAYLAQRIESANINDLYFQNVVCSAIIACEAATTVSWTLYSASAVDTWQAVGTSTVITNGATSLASGTWSATTTETRFNTGAVNIAGGTTGLMLVISRPTSAASQTLILGEVQLEEGSVATAFEQRPYLTELHLCGSPATNTLGYTAGMAVTDINGGQLAGLRNRIINGDMRIDQRNNGASVAPISQYTLDRWFYACTPAATKMSVQQVVDAPPGFMYSSKITVTTQYTPAVGEGFSISQQIEGTNIVDIQFGLSSAQTITISMWVKSSVAGTYSVSVRNGAATRSYVGTINVTTSWARQSITLMADVTGTWAKDNTSGLILALDLGSGSNFNTAAGSWVAGNFVRTSGSSNFVSQVAGSTINITGVQLEVGSVATPFEQRPIGMELALCHRYYSFGYGYGTSYLASASAIQRSVYTYPVPLRAGASPLVVTYVSGGATTPSVTNGSINALVVGFVSTGAGQEISYSVAASAEL